MNKILLAFTGFNATFRRELSEYFKTPLAYIFLAVFLLALGIFTWEASRFFDTGTADLAPFFNWHPWLYMIFLPALAMRLWADERGAGTDELLMSLPVGLPGLVFGKLCAAWVLAGVALLLTLPMWISVNVLGPADNTAITLAYFMSFLMAGAYVSIGAAVSSLTGSQVTAFVVSVVLAFVFTAAGWPIVLSGISDVFGASIADQAARFSFLSHFEAAQRGVLEFRSVLFYLSVVALFASLNVFWAARRRLS